jgi:succinoglycan biosynthesis transport protein ExoP
MKADDVFDADFQGDAPPAVGEVVVHDASASPVASAARLLRGRYGWAFGLGGALAVVGAWLGFAIPKPLYKSVGLIDVAPKVPRVLYGDMDEKGVLPMFDAFVVSEAALIPTRRVVDMAMASPEWKRFGRGTADESIAAFQDALQVTHPKYSEHIEVAFVDPNPEAAAVAVNQVINAYMKLVDERENLGGLSTRTKLENTRTVDAAKLAELRANELAITEDLGEPAIKARYDFYVAERSKLDTVIADLDLDIAGAKAGAQTGRAGRVLTDREIAIKDSGMDRLLLAKEQAERKVEHLVNVERLGEKNSELVAARDAVVTLDKQVKERSEAYRGMLAGSDFHELSLPEKEAHRARVAALRDDAVEQTKRLGKQLLALGNVKAEESMVAEQLESVKKRLEQINMESEVHGRISVTAYGDRPVEPDTDRRAPLGILGGVGGLVLGFGVVMLFGLREAQLRHLTDVRGGSLTPRLLGVVPDVSLDTERDPSLLTAQTTDYCVHHIRTMLQLRPPEKRKIVAFTSATPGAGKTTLGMALGMSFATTRSKTLLVDLDFFGHGLSSVMRSLVFRETKRALPGTNGNGNGHAVHEEEETDMLSGLLMARREAADESVRMAFVEALRKRAVDGDETCAKALSALETLDRKVRVNGTNGHGANGNGKGKKARGILGALAGRPLDECIIATGVPDLDLLPVGDALPADAARLSREGVHKLLAACRERYDVVLVDTGPVLGSIEAAFVAAAADDIVVVVSRGDRRPVVNDALERIEQIGGGGRVAGVVFNRASTLDIATSSYGSCSQSRAVDPR